MLSVMCIVKPLDGPQHCLIHTSDSAIQSHGNYFYPLYTGGLFYFYMLDESICHFRVVGSILALLLHGPSIFVVRAKTYGVLYNQASSMAFDETSRYWSTLKRSCFLGISLVTTR